MRHSYHRAVSSTQQPRSNHILNSLMNQWLNEWWSRLFLELSVKLTCSFTIPQEQIKASFEQQYSKASSALDLLLGPSMLPTDLLYSCCFSLNLQKQGLHFCFLRLVLSSLYSFSPSGLGYTISLTSHLTPTTTAYRVLIPSLSTWPHRPPCTKPASWLSQGKKEWFGQSTAWMKNTP